MFEFYYFKSYLALTYRSNGLNAIYSTYTRDLISNSYVRALQRDATLPMIRKPGVNLSTANGRSVFIVSREHRYQRRLLLAAVQSTHVRIVTCWKRSRGWRRFCPFIIITASISRTGLKLALIRSGDARDRDDRRGSRAFIFMRNRLPYYSQISTFLFICGLLFASRARARAHQHLSYTLKWRLAVLYASHFRTPSFIGRRGIARSRTVRDCRSARFLLPRVT